MDEQDVFDEETEVTETEEVEEAEETEKGVTEDKTEEEESPSSDSQTVPMSALLAERRKRQEAEERLEAQEKNKAPDPVTDPEGYEVYRESKELTGRIQLTQDLMRDLVEDYDEKEKVFLDLVSKEVDGQIQITDQTLYQKFISSPNPAKFAYNHAKAHEDYLEKTSDEYEKKVEEKILRRLKEAGALNVDAADLPDLTTVADVQSNNSLSEKGDSDRIDVFDE